MEGVSMLSTECMPGSRGDMQACGVGEVLGDVM